RFSEPLSVKRGYFNSLTPLNRLAAQLFSRRRTVSKIEQIIEKLTQAQSQLLTAADSISAEHWQTPPAEGRWCAADVVAHLPLVERGVLQSADRLTQTQPKAWPFYRRFHVPLQIVERRWIRAKSPRAVAPDRVGCKEDMLAELREVRERTLAFLEETN